VAASALSRLREAVNPFTFAVVTAGSEEKCRAFDVSDLLAPQRSELQELVRMYGHPDEPSRIFPILGDAGTGKSHLLATFQDALEREAKDRGVECLVIVVDNFDPATDAVDYILWAVVKHLLAQKGRGARQLGVIANRLAARLLAAALRRLPPDRQGAAIPPRGVWGQWRAFLGMDAATDRREAVRELIAYCEGPAPNDLPAACEAAGLPILEAGKLISEHLDATERDGATGLLRRELYFRLALRTLMGADQSVADFFDTGYREGPSARDVGRLPRLLLEILVHLCHDLEIPTVLVFDQLEDFLRAATPEQERAVWLAFGRGLASLVNNVPGLCLLVFSERGLWNEILNSMDVFVRDRLRQPFALPGRPTRLELETPDRIERRHIEGLIERRIRAALGADFDAAGLPAIFPFTDDHLKLLEAEPTIRKKLWKLGVWYNELVFGSGPPEPAPTDSPVVPPLPAPPTPRAPTLDKLIAVQWQAALAGANKKLEGEAWGSASIPEMQTALRTWLTELKERGLVTGPPWSVVEMIEDRAKGAAGYLTVVRFDAADAPGVGVAAWMSEAKARSTELKSRLDFFDAVPCPIRTLVLFRRDGSDALTGVTRKLFDGARAQGRDVRIVKYEQPQMAALLAFRGWVQAVRPDIEAAGTEGVTAYKKHLEKISDQLILWIEEWRRSEGKAV
jgi:hypothetical protein